MNRIRGGTNLHPALRIGCSGFNYADWKGTFYPRGLPRRKWLHYYCTIFKTVELNVTFYRLPMQTTFQRWHDETPEDFAFSLKGSRLITHVKRLKEIAGPVNIFFERALLLKEKLIAVLWQFSPAFSIDLKRLQGLLSLLKGYPVRNALEFRHQSWLTEETLVLCRDSNVSLCMADWPPFLDDLPITSDLVYIRRHGREGNYAASYTKAELKEDAKRIQGFLDTGRDVYIYFNNDANGHAPENAETLISLLQSEL